MNKIVPVQFKSEVYIFNDHYNIGDIKMMKETEAKVLEQQGRVEIITMNRDAVVISPVGDLKRYEKVVINEIRGNDVCVEDLAGNDYIVSRDNLRTV
jgi:hypothetical protein